MSDVRFIRVHGRVVPIKIEPGSGARGGNMRAAKNRLQKVGTGLANAGIIASGAAYIAHKTGRVLAHSYIKPVAIAGAVASLVGLTSASIGNKRRGKQSRALNTVEVSNSEMRKSMDLGNTAAGIRFRKGLFARDKQFKLTGK